EAEEAEIDQRLKKLAKGRPQSDYSREQLDKLPYSAFAKIIGPDAKEPGTLTEAKLKAIRKMGSPA
ncbi:MAG: hypothetical protein HC828_20235, partial [Blastochloris sp.]|nr:hypothetical protein [Blastochloris sp.]